MAPRTLQWPRPASAVALVAASLLFCWPLLAHAPRLPAASDVSFHAQRARGFIQALGEGVLYPRWLADANYGHGAPVFLLYPPFGYYAVALAQLPSGDVLAGLRIVSIVASLLCGLTFFLAARPVTSELGAVVGAALYVLLPYRGLNQYERLALGELVAFVWFPLLFAATRRLAAGPSWRAWVLLALSAAGLLLSHLVTAYMTLLVLGPYALLRARRARSWRPLPALLTAGVASALLASAYLVPMLVARPRVFVDGMVDGWFDWWRNFVYSVKVTGGFHGDPVQPWVDGSATTLLVLTIAAALVLALRRTGPAAAEGWMQVALALWTFCLQTELSVVVWRWVPQLSEVQFPWRFGAFQSLAVCFAAACALAPGEPGGKGSAKRRRQVPWLALCALVAGALPALEVTRRVTGARPYEVDAAMMASEPFRYRFAKEFLPRVVGDWRRFGEIAERGPEAVLEGGHGEVTVRSWESHARRLSVQTSAPDRLQLRTFAYPGWRARVDGGEVEVQAAPPFGRIALTLSPGAHEVEVVFGPTRDQRAGAAGSALGVVLLAGAAIAMRRREGRAAPAADRS